MDFYSKNLSANRLECSKILRVNLSSRTLSEGNCFPFLSTVEKARSILVLGMPNGCNWRTDIFRSDVWRAFTHLSTVVFGVLFLLFGLACIYLLLRRHKIDRFMIKTTVAVFITLAILGFSRAFLSLLISIAVEGKCGVPGETGSLVCLIFIRLAGALGFPSLTASYTLVFITLVLASKIKVGPECLQKPRRLIPLSLVHYVVAIVFEIVGLVSPGPAVIALVVCEAFYTLWGIFVCVIYMLIGMRLIKQIRHAIRTTSLVVRRSQKQRFSFARKGANNTRAQVTKLTRDVKLHHRRALRKVTIITYLAATLGIVYSLVSVARLVYTVFVLNGLCSVLNGAEPSNPFTWLVVCICLPYCIELPLGVLLVYSVTDVSPYVDTLKKLPCCGKRESEYTLTKPDIPMVKPLEKTVECTASNHLDGTADSHDQEETLCETIRISDTSQISAQTLQVDNVPVTIPGIRISSESLSSSVSSCVIMNGATTVVPNKPETVSLLAMSVDSTGSKFPEHYSPARKTSCPARPYSPANLFTKPTTTDHQLTPKALSRDMYAVIGVSSSDLRAMSQSSEEKLTASC